MHNNNQNRKQHTHYLSLAKAPGIIFLLVTGDNRSISIKQIKQFTKLINSKDYQMLVAIMQQNGRSLIELLTDIQNDSAHPLDQLRELCFVLDNFFPEDLAFSYKSSLLKLTETFIKRSSGIIGLLTNTSSGQEQTIITQVSNALDIANNESGIDKA